MMLISETWIFFTQKNKKRTSVAPIKHLNSLNRSLSEPFTATDTPRPAVVRYERIAMKNPLMN